MDNLSESMQKTKESVDKALGKPKMPGTEQPCCYGTYSISYTDCREPASHAKGCEVNNQSPVNLTLSLLR